jgi:hypothetical protein
MPAERFTGITGGVAGRGELAGGFLAGGVCFGCWASSECRISFLSYISNPFLTFNHIVTRYNGKFKETESAEVGIRAKEKGMQETRWGQEKAAQGAGMDFSKRRMTP